MPKAAAASPSRSGIATLLHSLAVNANELAGGRSEVSTTCRSLAKRILTAVTQQESARKSFFLLSPSSIATLLIIIAKCQDPLASCTALQIFLQVANRKRRCCRLVKEGAVDQAWILLISRQKTFEPDRPDKCLQQCLALLVRLAPYQKKFATRARLLGGVACICALLKTATGLVREPVLQLIKHLAVNALNATTMAKNGVVDHMTKLLKKSSNHNVTLAKHCVDAMVVLCKHKGVATSAIQQDLVGIAMTLVTQWSSAAYKMKPATCSTILTLMKSLTKHEAGRQALIKADGFQFLMKLMQSPTGKKGTKNIEKDTKKLAVVSAGILRCSFPRSALPVVSLTPQLRFTVPVPAELSCTGREDTPPAALGDEAATEEPDKLIAASESPTAADLEPFSCFFPERELFDAQGSVNTSDQKAWAGVAVRCHADDPLPTEVYHVLPFSEQVVSDVCPQVLPWRTKVDEPQVKSPAGVSKKLMLDDAMRYIEPECCINKTVFDLDQLLCRGAAPPPESLSSDNSNTVFKSPVALSAAPPPAGSPGVLRAAEDVGEVSTPGSKRSRLASSKSDVEPLQFDSRFECGNLRKAIQVRDAEYDLVLNADVNTDHHHQWFCFSVRGMQAAVKYRFNIINCEKPTSQFSSGMQPVMFSQKEYETYLRQRSAAASSDPDPGYGGAGASVSRDLPGERVSLELPGVADLQADQACAGDSFLPWKRVGVDLCYHGNNVCRCSEPGMQRQAKLSSTAKTFLTFSFSLQFPHGYDVCYLAYHYPYTYSRLQRVLAALPSSSEGIYVRRQTLCKTLSGNTCSLLTVTSPDIASVPPVPVEDPEGEDLAETSSERPYIFISSRVHPGESNSSWIMEGILQFLVSNHPLAVMLRRRYIFKIVPMLNPDGVINGHHRCSLSGHDLNRTWIAPCPVRQPTIHSTKRLIQFLRASGKAPRLFCDLHGHSRRKNIFMFGCSDGVSEFAGVEEEVFPRLLAGVAPAFSLKGCTFDVDKSKEATARVVGWRELGIVACYTMESTYCGADQGQYKGLQFSPYHLKEMGEAFCQALLLLDGQDRGRAAALQSDDLLRLANRISPAVFKPDDSEGEQLKKRKTKTSSSTQGDAAQGGDNSDGDGEDGNPDGDGDPEYDEGDLDAEELRYDDMVASSDDEPMAAGEADDDDNDEDDLDYEDDDVDGRGALDGAQGNDNDSDE